MSFNELERALAGLPVRPLDPAREARMLRAVLAAERPRRWWTRRVPLWQAALAGAAMVGLALVAPRLALIERRDGAGTPAAAAKSPRSPVVVRIDAPIVARASSRAHPLRLSEWTTLHTE
ncbi:MAG: hypothetical protein HRF50_05370 [Phycisphaerae bacterium]